MTPSAVTSSPELLREQSRAAEFLRRAVELAIDSGRLAGDPETVTRVFWGGFHGVASLEIAGEPQLGSPFEAPISAMEDALIEGNRPQARRHPRKAGPEGAPGGDS